MRKYTMVLLLVLSACGHVLAQKTFPEEKSLDWLIGKIKTSGKRVIIKKDMVKVAGAGWMQDNITKFWEIKGTLNETTNSITLDIYPMKISSFKNAGDTIFINGSDVFSLNASAVDKMTGDKVAIIMDYSNEDDLKARMKKAFQTFLDGKKAKRKSGEPF